MASIWRPSHIVTPSASRLLVERAHEEFLSGNLGDARLADVRGVVRASWDRAAAGHIAPDAAPPLEFTMDALRDYREQHPLAGRIEIVRRLLVRDAEDAGVIVAVGDAMGRLLWIEGDRGLRSLAGDMGFTEGANWSEAAMGTAAPGTALTLDQGVQIHAAEHFNRLVHPWSCTAVPVHDPESRRILGVIDITGGVEVVSPQALLLVEATARAVESELMVDRLRARASEPVRRRRQPAPAAMPTLGVLGRDKAVVELAAGAAHESVELSPRHAEILLLLAFHPQGLSAERLCELLYGEADRQVTLRAEMVRIRRALEHAAPSLVPESRPYRLSSGVESDAHHVLALLRRGAHRAALAAYRGAVLPGSVAPGVEAIRERVSMAMREAMLADATLDVLLAYAETEDGAGDLEVLMACLQLLPARSPKRASIVAAIEALELD